jgi:crossover junction endodeoxyribonuclease RuvC
MSPMPAPTLRLRILGIDPGTRHVGYGVIEAAGNALRHVASGCIIARTEDLAGRLVEIHAGLQEVIRAHAPTLAVVETVFAGENIKTAITIGEARGVALLSAAEVGLEVVGLEPAVVKRAVAGSGRAGKEQVQEMVRILLGLPAAPASDHEADALALAIAGANRRRAPALPIRPVRPLRRRG